MDPNTTFTTRTYSTAEDFLAALAGKRRASVCHRCGEPAALVVSNKAGLRRYACEDHEDEIAEGIAALGEGCRVNAIAV